MRLELPLAASATVNSVDAQRHSEKKKKLRLVSFAKQECVCIKRLSKEVLYYFISKEFNIFHSLNAIKWTVLQVSAFGAKSLDPFFLGKFKTITSNHSL